MVGGPFYPFAANEGDRPAMNDYDAAKHSKARLGVAGNVPCVPVMPVAAQISAMTGMLHLKLMGDSYVRATMPSVTPGAYIETVQAIKALPLEPSYSGSPSQYYRLDVVPDPNGFSAVLKAGSVVIGRVAVFGDAEIVSADMPLMDQVKEAQGGQGGPGTVSGHGEAGPGAMPDDDSLPPPPGGSGVN